MSETYSWNLYTRATPDDVWDAISTMIRGIAARPSWATDTGCGKLLVVREVTALGHARELGFTIAADARQLPCDVDWRVRVVDGGCLVRLSVIDPEEGWSEEVEQGWLPLLGWLGRMLDERALQ